MKMVVLFVSDDKFVPVNRVYRYIAHPSLLLFPFQYNIKYLINLGFSEPLCSLYRVPTRFGKVWKSMEFDLSNFQVWKSMEKINQSMEKYLCFQTIVPIVF